MLYLSATSPSFSDSVIPVCRQKGAPLSSVSQVAQGALSSRRRGGGLRWQVAPKGEKHSSYTPLELRALVDAKKKGGVDRLLEAINASRQAMEQGEGVFSNWSQNRQDLINFKGIEAFRSFFHSEADLLEKRAQLSELYYQLYLLTYTSDPVKAFQETPSLVEWAEECCDGAIDSPERIQAVRRRIRTLLGLLDQDIKEKNVLSLVKEQRRILDTLNLPLSQKVDLFFDLLGQGEVKLELECLFFFFRKVASSEKIQAQFRRYLNGAAVYQKMKTITVPQDKMVNWHLSALNGARTEDFSWVGAELTHNKLATEMVLKKAIRNLFPGEKEEEIYEVIQNETDLLDQLLIKDDKKSFVISFLEKWGGFSDTLLFKEISRQAPNCSFACRKDAYKALVRLKDERADAAHAAAANPDAVLEAFVEYHLPRILRSEEEAFFQDFSRAQQEILQIVQSRFKGSTSPEIAGYFTRGRIGRELEKLYRQREEDRSEIYAIKLQCYGRKELSASDQEALLELQLEAALTVLDLTEQRINGLLKEGKKLHADLVRLKELSFPQQKESSKSQHRVVAKDGKWFVFDLSRFQGKLPDDLDINSVQNALQDGDEVVRFTVKNGALVVHPKGSIRVFQENVEEVVRLYENKRKGNVIRIQEESSWFSFFGRVNPVKRKSKEMAAPWFASSMRQDQSIRRLQLIAAVQELLEKHVQGEDIVQKYQQIASFYQKAFSLQDRSDPDFLAATQVLELIENDITSVPQQTHASLSHPQAGGGARPRSRSLDRPLDRPALGSSLSQSHFSLSGGRSISAERGEIHSYRGAPNLPETDEKHRLPEDEDQEEFSDEDQGMLPVDQSSLPQSPRPMHPHSVLGLQLPLSSPVSRPRRQGRRRPSFLRAEDHSEISLATRVLKPSKHQRSIMRVAGLILQGTSASETPSLSRDASQGDSPTHGDFAQFLVSAVQQ